MSETHDEQAAQQAEQDRVDELAKQNEEVRRAEHPEEFAHEDKPAAADTAADENRAAAPVAPAGTGANEATPEEPADVRELDRLEGAARELRRRLFGGTA